MTLRNAFADLALEATQKAIQRGEHDEDTRYEFSSVSGDQKPLYIAAAPLDSDPAAAVWFITKWLWTAGPVSGHVPLLVQTRSPMKWNNRADPTLDGLAAWRSS